MNFLSAKIEWQVSGGEFSGLMFGKVPATDRHGDRCDLPVVGLTGLWRFSENGIGSACGNVRFQLFRTDTFDTFRHSGSIK